MTNSCHTSNLDDYKVLSKINLPSDLATLSLEELELLAVEIRDFLINTVSKTGGHLGAALGVVELTIALCYCFNLPKDKLVWDIGHQAYPYKILTGRKERLYTIRQPDGLSGFLSIFESPYDSFGAGHSSTSISAALGMAIASKLNNDDNFVVAIIGDGAISAGMAYEALNNCLEAGKRLIVILNDNDMSISKPTGAISRYLPRLASSKSYNFARELYYKTSSKLGFLNIAKRTEKSIKDFVIGSNIFEEMGFRYIGPIDGHDLKATTELLQNIKCNLNENEPILIHAKTIKGKGYKPAENAEDKFHGVASFDVKTGEQKQSFAKNYSAIFATKLSNIASTDPKVIAITAAMKSGTGLEIFEKQNPKQLFDVGIAEQHAVTFAAGLATAGYKPFVCLYSTFLQRAYDQVIHDVCIQNLPVRFMIDRAGFVGADGPTHNGVFDIGFLSIIPNIVICGSSDEASLTKLTELCYNHNSSPITLRYAKSSVQQIYPADEVFEVYKAKVISNKGYRSNQGSAVCLVGFGITVKNCIDASQLLMQKNIKVSLVDAVFAKPIDTETFAQIAKEHDIVIVVDENSFGGLSTILMEFFYNYKTLRYIPVRLKDEFFEHDTINAFHAKQGLDAKSIALKVADALGLISDEDKFI